MLPASTPLGLRTPRRVASRLRLGTVTVAQSFAVDPSTGFAYVAQVSVGGERAGHLTISRLDLGSGRVTAKMWLRGFGHGVAIGVEPNPASHLDPHGCWLWVECGPVQTVDGSARGTRIARLAFVPGRTVTCAKGRFTGRTSKGVALSPQVTVLKPPGPRCTPSVDGDTLGLRWWNGHHYLWAAYSLDAARQGHLEPLSSPVPLQSSALFQGWCLHGSHAYCLLGKAGQPATVAVLDLLTGDTAPPHSTGVHESGYTEPEGIAVVNGRIQIGTATGRVGARRLTVHQL